jgi:phosphate transport system permease protein
MPAPTTPSAPERAAAVPPAARARRRAAVSRLLRGAGAAGSSIPLLALIFVLATLLIQALPAIAYNGGGFFTGTAWRPGNFYANGVTTNGVAHPPGVDYSVWPLIVGTLASSLIAMIVAVPVSIGAALVIVERLPRRVADAVGMLLELLAGIPSVVIGLWGALTFGPLIARDIAPILANHAPDVPVLNFFRGPTGYGEGLLTSGLVLAVMIIPIVAATTRDLLRQVPLLPREGALALGMSEWETARRVTLPWIRTGIIGAVVLGLGRALGETMAVAMVSGAVTGTLPTNLYATMSTISATIVSQLDSALTDATGFAVRTLAEAGLVLMVITLAANIAARVLVRRTSGTALPVGRGI